MRLLSVNVGVPRRISWNGREVTTAIFKDPVQGPRRVGRINIEGDDQADRLAHGGEHRAVFVYQIEAYRYWQEQLGATTSHTASSGRTSRSRGCPTTRCAWGTTTASAAPCSRSPNPA